MLYSVNLSLSLLYDFREYVLSLTAAAAAIVARAGGAPTQAGQPEQQQQQQQQRGQVQQQQQQAQPESAGLTDIPLHDSAAAPEDSDSSALMPPPAAAPAQRPPPSSFWLWRWTASARGWWRARVSPWLGDASLVEDGTLTVRQMRVMRTFRMAAVGFLAVDGFFQAWPISFRADSSILAGYVATEAAALALLVFLLVTFRPRAAPAAGPLYDPRGYTGTAYERLIDHAERLQAEQEAAAAARGPPLVIVNPDSQVDVSTGKFTGGTVALAEPSRVSRAQSGATLVAMPPGGFQAADAGDAAFPEAAPARAAPRGANTSIQ